MGKDTGLVEFLKRKGTGLKKTNRATNHPLRGKRLHSNLPRPGGVGDAPSPWKPHPRNPLVLVPVCLGRCGRGDEGTSAEFLGWG